MSMSEQEAAELIAYLESDQLVAERSRPLPRARLGRWSGAGLWALRIVVVVLSALVIYTFVAQLGS
jgi:4-hydroxybenzoate polyprenyltransferase